MVGIEAENTGLDNDQPWPEVQVDAYARGVAALARHAGFGVEMVCGHKEWALPKGRKIDPTFDCDAFRMRVAGVLNGGVVRAPIPKADAAKRPTLRVGAKGEDVKLVQRVVGVEPDGKFGSATEAAVRAYQRAHKLAVADGIAGPAFWATLPA
jgi:N-acetyl-anhydromuramyl-L-alanine amidase AmpD